MTEATASRPLAPTQAATPPRWARFGVAFGVLSALAIALYGPIGVSTTYPRVIGAVLRRIAPAYASGNAYVTKVGALLTPETMLVVGLLIGGFIAARTGASRATRAPAAEMAHAGEHTTGRRYADAFIGGFLIIFGARLAGGCTSGHIISGITQLGISSMIFAVAVFASGIATAKLLARGGH